MQPITPTLFWIGLAVSALLVFRLYRAGAMYLKAGVRQYQYTQGAAALCQAVVVETQDYVKTVANLGVRLSRKELDNDERLALMLELADLTTRHNQALLAADVTLKDLVKVADVVVNERGRVLSPPEAEKYVVEKYRNNPPD